MKTRLFVAEIRKNLTALRAFFAAFLMLSAVTGMLVFAASRMLYRNESMLRATIAVVSLEKEASYIERFASYLGELSSAASALDFQLMSEEEAGKKLEDGEVFAVMVIPDGMMNGILYGNNIPAEVILPDDPSLQSVVFAELTRAGARLLSAAQSGTYTATELFNRAERTEKLWDAYNKIDLINFSYVLSREDCFTQGVILPGAEGIRKGAAPENAVTVYYICSGILLFVFFSASAFSSALKREDKAFYSLYASRGRKWYGAVLIKYAAHALILFASLTTAYIIALIIQGIRGGGILPLSFGVFFFVLILSLLVAAFDLFCHMITSKSSGAVLLQLCISLFMLFAGGGILPEAFLPGHLAAVGRLLPMSFLHHGLMEMVNGQAGFPPAVLLVHILLLLLMGTGAFYLRAGGDRL